MVARGPGPPGDPPHRALGLEERLRCATSSGTAASMAAGQGLGGPTAAGQARGVLSHAACADSDGSSMQEACASSPAETCAQHAAASTGTEVSADRQDGPRICDIADSMSVDELRWWLLGQRRLRSSHATTSAPAPAAEPAWLSAAATALGFAGTAAAALDGPAAHRTRIGRATPAASCVGREVAADPRRRCRSQRRRPRGRRSGARQQRRRLSGCSRPLDPCAAPFVPHSVRSLAPMGARQALFMFGQRARAAGIRLESREQRAMRLHRERLMACFPGIRAARLQRERLTACFRGLVLRVHLRALGFVRAAHAQRSDALVHYVPCVTCRMNLAARAPSPSS